MRRELLSAVVTVAILMGASSVLAATETLTFEDNNPGAIFYNPLPTSYHGFTWTNWATLNGPSTFALSGYNGYTNGVISGENVGCGCGPDFFQPSETIARNADFGLVSGYFTSAWNDGETLTIQGYNGATLVDSTSFTINTESPVFETFNWTGLTSVVFTASGGTPLPLLGSGEYFAVDDLSVSGVPEPAQWAVLLAGFAGLGGALRSRRRFATA